MSAEATQLRDLLGLSERETWMDKEDEAVIADAGETQTQTHSFTYSFSCRSLSSWYVADLAENVNKEVKSDKKDSAAAAEEKSGTRAKLKKEPLPTAKKTVEVRGECISTGECKSERHSACVCACACE